MIEFKINKVAVRCEGFKPPVLWLQLANKEAVNDLSQLEEKDLSDYVVTLKKRKAKS